MVYSLLAITASIACLSAVDEHRPDPNSLLVEVVDSDGHPVGDADVCFGAAVTTQSDEGGRTATTWQYWEHAKTDVAGRAELKKYEQFSKGRALVVRHEERRIAGCVEVDERPTANPLVLTLLPEVEITGQLHCEALEARSVKYFPVGAAVGIGRRRVLGVRGEKGRIRFSLPPGEYDLSFDTYLHRTKLISRKLSIAPKSGPVDLGRIELPPVKAELLVGEPAPEIPDIVAWKNDSGQTLLELRGQVVLLDFWGYWCSSCVKDMPQLFALHDKYSNQGLSIIGVHVDKSEDASERVDTTEKLDGELAAARRMLWGDRDLPFSVALVATNAQKYGRSEDGRASNAAEEAYGIAVYPTHVLIDRRGNVARVFAGGIHFHEDGIALLEKLLAEK
jgi:thiol-disulfide isomerase/thioredoxin